MADTTRRDLLKAGAIGGAAAAVGCLRLAEAAERSPPMTDTVRKGDMLYRTLGRTGEQVSLIGLGGHHIGRPSEEEGIRIVRSAIDRGITFLDNCWDYHDGGSELRMGKALRDGYRNKV